MLLQKQLVLSSRSSSWRCNCHALSKICWRILEPRNILLVNCLVLVLNICLIATQNGWMSGGSWPVETFFQSPLDQSEKLLLQRTFKTFQTAVAAANIPYFVFSGSLIGSYRHHGLIPWDDDIDVIINSSLRHGLHHVLSTFSPEYKVHAAGGVDGVWQWKFYPVEGHPLLHRSYRTPYLDVFFYAENETHVWNTSPYFPKECWPKRVTFPLRHRPFGDVTVAAPCDPAAFLGVTVDVGECRNRDYSHLMDLPVIFGHVTVPCDQLAHVYPFVHRGPRNSSTQLVTETLRLGNWTLNSIDIQDTC